MDEADVVVVGGGVAGCATATWLARRGARVVVLERGRYPREKVCGEGLMPHGVAALDALGALDALVARGARPFDGIVWHAEGHRAVGRFPAGTGLGVRRLHLDEAVAARAANAGADVRFGCGARTVAVDDRGVQVTTDDGVVHARVVVGADGRGSLVRRQLGLERPARRPHRYGLRGHFLLAPGRSEGRFVEVFVGPRAELYWTPTGPGEVNLAALCSKEVVAGGPDGPARTLAALIAEVPEVHARLADATPASTPGLVGPLRRTVSDVVADRALLVGDASGFVDAITGEGMSLALVCAGLAAETLTRCLASDRLDARALRPYARARAARASDRTRLTEVVLWGVRHRALAGPVVGQLARHPELFGRLLADGRPTALVGALARALLGRVTGAPPPVDGPAVAPGPSSALGGGPSEVG